MITMRRLLMLAIICVIVYLRFAIFGNDQHAHWVRNTIIVFLIGLSAAVVLQIIGVQGVFSGK